MKKCPTCDRTFDDSLKFCQIDGTPLVNEGDFSESPNEFDSRQTEVFGQSESNLGFIEDETKVNVSKNAPPSPFNEPVAADYRSNSAPPFKEPEPMFNESPSSFNQSSFGNSQPMQQTEWTPPPAPDIGWQNQSIGQNTPFQPPMVGGQNQTLAIVSLVCGILSIVCCWFSILVGPAGFITGYMAKSRADQNPAQYGGRGMALAGMITGGIGTALGLLFIILQLLGALAGNF